MRIAVVLVIIMLSCLGLTELQAMQLCAGRPISAESGGCTGGEIFAYHFENSNDVTVGTPTGCSAGDEVATNTNVTFESSSPAPQDGTWSALFDSSGDKLEFDPPSAGMDTAGTVDKYIYLDAFTDNGEIFKLDGGGGNQVLIGMTGTEEIFLIYEGNTDQVTLITTGCDLVTGEWIHIIGKWRQGAENPSTYISCDSPTGGTDSDQSDTDLTDFSSAPTTVIMGSAGGTALSGNMDNLHIYDAWQ